MAPFPFPVPANVVNGSFFSNTTQKTTMARGSVTQENDYPLDMTYDPADLEEEGFSISQLEGGISWLSQHGYNSKGHNIASSVSLDQLSRETLSNMFSQSMDLTTRQTQDLEVLRAAHYLRTGITDDDLIRLIFSVLEPDFKKGVRRLSEGTIPLPILRGLHSRLSESLKPLSSSQLLLVNALAPFLAGGRISGELLQEAFRHYNKEQAMRNAHQQERTRIAESFFEDLRDLTVPTYFKDKEQETYLCRKLTDIMYTCLGGTGVDAHSPFLGQITFSTYGHSIHTYHKPYYPNNLAVFNVRVGPANLVLSNPSGTDSRIIIAAGSSNHDTVDVSASSSMSKYELYGYRGRTILFEHATPFSLAVSLPGMGYRLVFIHNYSKDDKKGDTDAAEDGNNRDIVDAIRNKYYSNSYYGREWSGQARAGSPDQKPDSAFLRKSGENDLLDMSVSQSSDARSTMSTFAESATDLFTAVRDPHPSKQRKRTEVTATGFIPPQAPSSDQQNGPLTDADTAAFLYPPLTSNSVVHFRSIPELHPITSLYFESSYVKLRVVYPFIQGLQGMARVAGYNQTNRFLLVKDRANIVCDDEYTPRTDDGKERIHLARTKWLLREIPIVLSVGDLHPSHTFGMHSIHVSVQHAAAAQQKAPPAATPEESSGDNTSSEDALEIPGRKATFKGRPPKDKSDEKPQRQKQETTRSTMVGDRIKGFIGCRSWHFFQHIFMGIRQIPISYRDSIESRYGCLSSFLLPKSFFSEKFKEVARFADNKTIKQDETTMKTVSTLRMASPLQILAFENYLATGAFVADCLMKLHADDYLKLCLDMHRDEPRPSSGRYTKAETNECHPSLLLLDRFLGWVSILFSYMTIERLRYFLHLRENPDTNKFSLIDTPVYQSFGALGFDRLYTGVHGGTRDASSSMFLADFGTLASADLSSLVATVPYPLSSTSAMDLLFENPLHTRMSTQVTNIFSADLASRRMYAHQLADKAAAWTRMLYLSLADQSIRSEALLFTDKLYQSGSTILGFFSTNFNKRDNRDPNDVEVDRATEYLNSRELFRDFQATHMIRSVSGGMHTDLEMRYTNSTEMTTTHSKTDKFAQDDSENFGLCRFDIDRFIKQLRTTNASGYFTGSPEGMTTKASMMHVSSLHQIKSQPNFGLQGMAAVPSASVFSMVGGGDGARFRVVNRDSPVFMDPRGQELADILEQELSYEIVYKRIIRAAVDGDGADVPKRTSVKISFKDWMQAVADILGEFPDVKRRLHQTQTNILKKYSKRANDYKFEARTRALDDKLINGGCMLEGNICATRSRFYAKAYGKYLLRITGPFDQVSGSYSADSSKASTDKVWFHNVCHDMQGGEGQAGEPEQKGGGGASPSAEAYPFHVMHKLCSPNVRLRLLNNIALGQPAGPKPQFGAYEKLPDDVVKALRSIITSFRVSNQSSDQSGAFMYLLTDQQLLTLNSDNVVLETAKHKNTLLRIVSGDLKVPGDVNDLSQPQYSMVIEHPAIKKILEAYWTKKKATFAIANFVHKSLEQCGPFSPSARMRSSTDFTATDNYDIHRISFEAFPSLGDVFHVVDIPELRIRSAFSPPCAVSSTWMNNFSRGNRNLYIATELLQGDALYRMANESQSLYVRRHRGSLEDCLTSPGASLSILRHSYSNKHSIKLCEGAICPSALSQRAAEASLSLALGRQLQSESGPAASRSRAGARQHKKSAEPYALPEKITLEGCSPEQLASCSSILTGLAGDLPQCASNFLLDINTKWPHKGKKLSGQDEFMHRDAEGHKTINLAVLCKTTERLTEKPFALPSFTSTLLPSVLKLIPVAALDCRKLIQQRMWQFLEQFTEKTYIILYDPEYINKLLKDTNMYRQYYDLIKEPVFLKEICDIVKRQSRAGATFGIRMDIACRLYKSVINAVMFNITSEKSSEAVVRSHNITDLESQILEIIDKMRRFFTETALFFEVAQTFQVYREFCDWNAANKHLYTIDEETYILVYAFYSAQAESHAIEKLIREDVFARGIELRSSAQKDKPSAI